MKIQLQSLRVLNCGPLRDVCIHFAADGDSPVTVLAGANGSGKTTALELIFGLAEMLLPHEMALPHSAFSSFRSTLLRTEYAQMDWLVDGEKFSLFHGNRPSGTELSGNHFGRSGTPGNYATYFHGSILNTLWTRIQNQESGATVDAFATSERDFSQPNPEVPSFLFFPHIRSLEAVRGKQMYNETVQYRWTYLYQNAGQFEGSLDSYLVWLDYVEHEAYEKAIQFLNDLDIDGKTFSISRRDFKVKVTTPSGGSHFLEGMSSGEQNILIMLLELRRRLLPYSIVLIDEIENSLHPAFQYRMANGLKRLQETVPFQLIVTSHSPAILETFGTQSARILTQF